MQTDRGDDQDESREALAGIQEDHAITRGATLCSEDWSLVEGATQPANLSISNPGEDFTTTSYNIPSGLAVSMANHSGTTEATIERNGALRRTISQLRDKHRTAFTLRETVRTLRSSLDSVLQVISDSEARIVELAGELMYRIDLTRLEVFREQLRMEHASVEENQGRSSLIELELHDVESRIRSIDRKLAKLTGRILHFLDGYTDSEDFPTVEDDSELRYEASHPASPVVAPMLAQYYSYAADAEIMAERLRLLDFDYQEDLAVRGFKQDDDEVLSLPDDDFERAYGKFISRRLARTHR